MSKLKGKKKTKIIVLAVIIVIIAFFVYRSRQSASAPAYVEDTAAKQDINVYHSFTGTVAAVNSQSVMSAVSGVKVTEVDVKEGDTVKEGDVIAKLDTTTIDEQIKEKEITMSQTSKSNDISVKTAKKSYDDLTKNIADGLDSTRQSAQSSIDAAYLSLLTACNAYNNEVSLNNEQLSSTIMSAIQSIDSASRSLEAAELSTQQAKDAKAHAQAEAEKKGMEYDPFSSDQSIASSNLSEKSARASYDNAVKSYKVAKITEENSLTSLFDQLISAQNAYFDAINSFNATIRSQEQQLEGYKLQIDQAELSADDSLSTLQLDDLKKQRDENYTIKAPLDGQITKLSVKAGDITAVSTTTSLATITDYSTMKVNIKVGEYDITSLSEGDDVTISVPALSKEYPGKISHIDREATSANGVSYFNATVEFTADADIKAGLSAEVKLNVVNAPGVVAIANSDIMTDADGSSYVYVKKDGQKDYTKQIITCGVTDGQYTEIKDGLSDGDTFYVDVMNVGTASSESDEYYITTDSGDGTVTTDGSGVSASTDAGTASSSEG